MNWQLFTVATAWSLALRWDPLHTTCLPEVQLLENHLRPLFSLRWIHILLLNAQLSTQHLEATVWWYHLLTTAPHVLLMAAFCYHCRRGTKSEYHVRNQNSDLLKQTSMVTTPLSVTSWHGEEVFRTRHQELTDVKSDALAQYKKKLTWSTLFSFALPDYSLAMAIYLPKAAHHQKRPHNSSVISSVLGKLSQQTYLIERLLRPQ